MLKRVVFPLMLICTMTRTAAHPVHVSVVNLTIHGTLIRIMVNTFVDDWETAYYHYHGRGIQLKLPEHHNGSWFTGYFHSSFRIADETEGNQIELSIDTVYFNDMSMTMELHCELKKEPKSLYIYNAILTDIFADQTNLLIYSANGVEKGIRFDYYKHEETVMLP